jgi:uncharacterized protein (TIGR03086 family)
MEVIDALEQTFQHASTVIGNVTPEQYGNATPCADWTVEELLGHMVGVVDGLCAAAGGRTPEAFELGVDPAAQFAATTAAALAAWRTPGALDRMVEIGAGSMPGRVVVSINVLDTATHVWDLATATGQPTELPEPVAVAAFEASQMTVSPELRVGRFGPEVTAPEGASTTGQLVAFLGRTS